MKKLYIDFDGVIMTTNKNIDELILNNKLHLKTQDEIMKFIQNIQWENLLESSDEISDAFTHLQTLNNSDDFSVSILTHVCSIQEAEAKKKLLSKKVGNIEVIPVPKTQEKCHFVDPTNAILVDDYTKNLELWEQHGGIGIKFTDKEHTKFKATYNLKDLFDIL